MRVSPIGFRFDASDEVLAQARLSADLFYNHPEVINGAQVGVRFRTPSGVARHRPQSGSGASSGPPAPLGRGAMQAATALPEALLSALDKPLSPRPIGPDGQNQMT